MQQQAFHVGQRVRIGENDLGLNEGREGQVAGIAEETGYPLVYFAGRGGGRLAVMPQMLSLVAAEEEPPADANAIIRPLYLDRADTAEELGVSVVLLGEIAKHAGVDACGERRCRFVAQDIRRLKAFHRLMVELDVPAATVGKIQAYLARKKNGGA